MASEADYAVCQRLLREQAIDWYYACLFLPKEIQPHAFALLSFAQEIAQIRDRVSEPMPGEIRLQWWREVLGDQREGEAAANPLSNALMQTIQTKELGSGPLIRLIEARRFDLYDDPMGDLTQYEGYCGETRSILFQYIGLVIGQDHTSLADASGHAGVALGLVEHIYGLGRARQSGQIFLPNTIFEQSGVGASEFLNDGSSEQMRAIIEPAILLSEQHLEKALGCVKQLPKELRVAFKILKLVQVKLDRLKKAQYQLEATSSLSPLSSLFYLWRGV